MLEDQREKDKMVILDILTYSFKDFDIGRDESTTIMLLGRYLTRELLIGENLYAFCKDKQLQSCQFSRILRETPAFREVENVFL